MMNAKDHIVARQRRTDEEKVRIVEETLGRGTSVSIVARRHNVNANQVFAWKRQYRNGVLGASNKETTLVPVGVIDGEGNVTPLEDRPKSNATRHSVASSPVAPSSSYAKLGLEPGQNAAAILPEVSPRSLRDTAIAKHAPMIEVELRGGSRIRIDAEVKGVALKQMLKLIRRLA